MNHNLVPWVKKMANKFPISKNEVKKAKFRFNFTMSDDGNLGAAHTQSHPNVTRSTHC